MECKFDSVFHPYIEMFKSWFSYWSRVIDISLSDISHLYAKYMTAEV